MLIYSVMKQEIEWVIESFTQTIDLETLIHSGTKLS